MLARQFDEIAHGGLRADGDGIADHPGLELLHRSHFARLLLERHVLVNDANATFLREGNGKA